MMAGLEASSPQTPAPEPEAEVLSFIMQLLMAGELLLQRIALAAGPALRIIVMPAIMQFWSSPESK